MGRRVFSAEFKREAVSPVRDRGVEIRQAATDLGIHAGVVGHWGREVKVTGRLPDIRCALC